MSQALRAHRTRIKFCGNTRLEDALLAAELGVDYLGFVMVPGSPRNVAAEQAQVIAAALVTREQAPRVVALFQNADPASIAQQLLHLRPVLLQFHGRESPVFCASFGLPWIKAIPMGEPQRFSDWERDFSAATALLADSHTAAGGGGSGHAFSWAQLPAAGERKLPLLLAGGLKPETVGEAIRIVRPWGVDVSSGIESGTKGVKDHRKMRAFVEAVRAADEA